MLSRDVFSLSTEQQTKCAIGAAVGERCHALHCRALLSWTSWLQTADAGQMVIFAKTVSRDARQFSFYPFCSHISK